MLGKARAVQNYETIRAKMTKQSITSNQERLLTKLGYNEPTSHLDKYSASLLIQQLIARKEGKLD